MADGKTDTTVVRHPDWVWCVVVAGMCLSLAGGTAHENFPDLRWLPGVLGWLGGFLVGAAAWRSI